MQNALLVGEAVRGVCKVALGVCRSAHDVLIAQGCLLRLGHFLVGLRDTLGHGEGFQIDHGHIDAQLLQRLRFTGDSGAELLKCLRGVEVVERRHITGKTCQRHGHFLHVCLSDAHGFEHGAQGRCELLGLQFAFAESFCGVSGPLVYLDSAIGAEGGIHHVLHLVEVRCHADGGFAELNNFLGDKGGADCLCDFCRCRGYSAFRAVHGIFDGVFKLSARFFGFFFEIVKSFHGLRVVTLDFVYDFAVFTHAVHLPLRCSSSVWLYSVSQPATGPDALPRKCGGGRRLLLS